MTSVVIQKSELHVQQSQNLVIKCTAGCKWTKLQETNTVCKRVYSHTTAYFSIVNKINNF